MMGGSWCRSCSMKLWKNQPAADTIRYLLSTRRGLNEAIGQQCIGFGTPGPLSCFLSYFFCITCVATHSRFGPLSSFSSPVLSSRVTFPLASLKPLRLSLPSLCPFRVS